MQDYNKKKKYRELENFNSNSLEIINYNNDLEKKDKCMNLNKSHSNLLDKDI